MALISLPILVIGSITYITTCRKYLAEDTSFCRDHAIRGTLTLELGRGFGMPFVRLENVIEEID